MSKVASKARPSRSRAVRTGRPPRELAGEVENRILDAARDVFLESGLAGATVDQIAARARAGKPTIYARFPSKQVLFTAVVMRNVAANVERFQTYVPSGASIQERLASLGAAILHWALSSDTVELMRLGIAEARRFPDLASRVHAMAKDRGIEAVAKLLSEIAGADELRAARAFAPERLPTTTRFFLDLVLLPLLMQALSGEKAKTLQREIAPHVARSVSFFLAACRAIAD